MRASPAGFLNFSLAPSPCIACSAPSPPSGRVGASGGCGFWRRSPTFGVLVARQRALARFYAYDGQRPAPTTPQERTRERYVISYTTVAVLAFVVARAVMPPPESADAEAPRVIGALVLITVAGLAALAAGWSAIWAFKNPGAPHSDRPTSGT